MSRRGFGVRCVPAWARGAVIAVLVVACAGTSGSPTAPLDIGSPAPATAPLTSPPAPTADPTERPAGSYEACDEAAATPILLRVRDAEPADAVGGVLDSLTREFEAANPGVSVRREPMSPDELVATTVADLGRADGPDIAQVPQGPAGLGAVVQAGVALQLTEAETAYGWTDRWAPRTLARLRLSADGRTLGEGSLYGVPVTGELAGLMFSDRVGHESSRPLREPPKTLDEEMADYASILESGLVPIRLGGADGGLRLLYGSLLGSLVTPEWLDAFVYRREGASFDVKETAEAARLIVEMRDRGFLERGFATMSTEEAFSRFAVDGAQFLVTGSWAWPALKATGDPYLLVTLEPRVAGGPVLAVGGTGRPFVIRKTSPSAACAAGYLDFITSDHAMDQVAALELVLPSHVSAGALGSDPWFRDGMTFPYRDIESGNLLGHDLDWAFPGAAETLDAELAKLLEAKTTPEQFAANVDAAYQAFLAAD